LIKLLSNGSKQMIQLDLKHQTDQKPAICSRYTLNEKERNNMSM